MSKVTERRVVNQVLDYIRDLDQHGTYKIYFAGERDYDTSNRIQELSNLRKVGVIARNKTVGLTLFHLVRIIDEPGILIDEIEALSKEDESATTEDIVNSFVESEDEDESAVWFEMNEPIGVVLPDETSIKRSLSEVDLWTFERVKNELNKLF